MKGRKKERRVASKVLTRGDPLTGLDHLVLLCPHIYCREYTWPGKGPDLKTEWFNLVLKLTLL